jgi:Pyruvate/2-oxoacid:ferredoxin oxidoreductase delta subunit
MVNNAHQYQQSEQSALFSDDQQLDECSLCWYWCALFTITAWRCLFALLILVWIVDRHCLEVLVWFIDIGGIIFHHCLEVILCFVDIGVHCWPSLLRGDCLLCWYWCELLIITHTNINNTINHLYTVMVNNSHQYQQSE